MTTGRKENGRERQAAFFRSANDGETSSKEEEEETQRQRIKEKHSSSLMLESPEQEDKDSENASFGDDVKLLLGNPLTADNQSAQERSADCPYERASWFSHFTLSWVSPLIALGFQRPLQEEDIWRVPTKLTAASLSSRLDDTWERAAQRPGPFLKHRRLLWALYFFSRRLYWLSGLCYLIHCAVTFMQPFAVKSLLWYLNGGADGHGGFFGITSGVGLTFALALCNILSVITLNFAFYLQITFAFESRQALMDAVYRKSLRLSSTAKNQSSTGDIVTLMSVDTERIWNAVINIHWLWASPLMILMSMALLVAEIGVSGLMGVLIMVLVLGLQYFTARRTGRLREQVVKHTGSRVRLMNEILQGIRVVKYYAWESSVKRRIGEAREEELKNLRLFEMMRSFNVVLLFVAPVFIATTTFLTYSALGQTLSVPTVFTAMAYLALLRRPLTTFPAAITGIAEGSISLARLERYFSLGEAEQRDHGGVLKKPSAEQRESRTEVVPIGSIRLTNVDFQWTLSTEGGFSSPPSPSASTSKGPSLAVVAPVNEEVRVELKAEEKEGNSFSLRNLCLDIRPGEFVGVVGHVGSGKSSLLQGILGLMHQTGGVSTVKGCASYTSQQCWLQNSSIRDNILFQLEYDEARYREAVRAAQLVTDLKNLPAGDMTEIGERGINLSGGQKARISLARALYRRGHCNIFLFDDPLSAVDPAVASRIFSSLLAYLKGETRVLVLNAHYHFLRHVDRVIVMDKGRIAFCGQLDEALQKFPTLLGEVHQLEGEDHVATPLDPEHLSSSSGHANSLSLPPETNSPGPVFVSVTSPRPAAPPQPSGDELAPLGNAQHASARLIDKEEREVGAVSLSTYKSYVAGSAHRRGGFARLLLILLGFCVSQSFRIGSDMWLSYWSQDSFHLTAGGYIAIYCTIGLLTFFITLWRSTLFVSVAIRSSRLIHEELFENVLAAPVNLFFDVTPTGRVLNRFSKDLDQLDSALPENFSSFLQNVVMITAMFLTCAFVSPWMLALYGPILGLFFGIQRYFRRSSTELKRLEGISRSPLFSSFSEMLNGLGTIRAFQLQDDFIDRYRQILDKNSSLYFLFNMAGRWLALRLDLLVTLLVVSICVISVAMRDSVSPGMTGLALSYALQMTGLVQWVVRLYVLLENTMTSAERLLHYSSIKPEAPALLPNDQDLPKDWPQKGAIEFRGVKLRYRPDLELVLKGINLTVRPMEKIGIVGRTGAGKSSIVQALFRIIELDSGKIIIDGVDISTVGLQTLRSRFAIIPQDPVLFSGTIRSNLDPFEEYEDSELWNTLSRVNLKRDIQAMPGQLHGSVSENGENLSVGQRQLICICRALLRQSKIIVIDEATANVDTSTDAVIQQAIRQNFADRTVLCIAHRLETIIDSDRVAVMSAGVAVECDAPSRLLKDPNSHFYALVTSLGSRVHQKLLTRAQESSFARNWRPLSP